jgi:hypothetical protein
MFLACPLTLVKALSDAVSSWCSLHLLPPSWRKLGIPWRIKPLVYGLKHQIMSLPLMQNDYYIPQGSKTKKELQQ